jgi:hypothetical protein
MGFGKSRQSHLLAQQAVDELTVVASQFEMLLQFRRNTVMIMKSFSAVAIFLEILGQNQIVGLNDDCKQHQDFTAATSNNLANERLEMLPVPISVRENPQPFPFLVFGS